MHVSISRLSLLATAVLLACKPSDRGDAGAASGENGGTVVMTIAGEPDFLIPPFIELATGNQVADLIFDRLAEPGLDLNTFGDRGFEPELAESWTWGADSLSISFKLNSRARWHDGRPVTSRDVRFTHQLYTDSTAASPVAGLLTNIDSVSTPDSLTAVFWFKRRHPEQFFDASYQMRILPEHALSRIRRSDLRSSEFNRRPIGSGPFRFVRWEPGALVELAADTTNYRGRPKLDRVIWSIAPGYPPALAKLLAGEADFIEFVPPPVVPQIREKPELELRPYGSLDYGFVQLNLRDQANARRPHPLFGDRALRRALSMAVDRPAIVRNVFGDNGRVAFGPFTRAVATADTTIAQLPYDTAAAARLLDSLGWRDRNGDGVRERNGRQLRFSLAFPTSSAIRRQAATLLQESFRKVGARVDIEPYELTAFSSRLRDGKFDAAMNAWHLDPSPGVVRQSWGGEAARSGGVNYGKYESQQFDAYMDSAAHEMDLERARAHWRRAYETIIADAPAIFLYETVNNVGVHKRVRTPGMRADAWWSDVRDWSIPEAERIPRDRIGAGAAPAPAR
ncbi:MAG TPA: peptide ABC transporter substrate-binding protein [Gemmatimonadaceae bacterium]|nr:peptide ABC transporter substrate-binding protein [Gemmatimonadaceae bacterium]